MATPYSQPSAAALRLAERLRDLREREFGRITQSDLGRALGGSEPLSPATISIWENPASGRVPPSHRLEAYALLFCSARAFEGEVRMSQLEALTADERDRFEELKSELLRLRDKAVAVDEVSTADRPRSMWHFPDGSRITLASSRISDEFRPPYAEPVHQNYIRTAGLGDLDALIEIYGAIRAYNPTSPVAITAAEDLDPRRDVPSDLVLIGGRAWAMARVWFSRIFPFPIEPEDPYERGSIVVNEPDGSKREFKATFVGDQLVEDIGFIARGANPAAPQRTLTICGGITTRGVHGAAKAFIDPELRERNERYLIPRFPRGSTYYIVMRIPVFKAEALTPDLSIAENRLFEWSDAEDEPA